MKKTIVTFIFITYFFNSFAQSDSKLSYGATGGVYAFMINNLSSGFRFDPKDNKSIDVSYTFGGYIEYQFAQKFGVKTLVNYRQIDLDYINHLSETNYKPTFSLTFIEISPLLKYNRGTQYRKGFYMVFGPKISFMTKAEESGEDEKDVFNTTMLGAQYGIGTRIAKVLDFEIRFDYELTPFYETSGGIESHLYGVNANLYIDLQRLLSSKKM